MDVSCAFPTTMSSPEDIALAEDIGYRRAWLYDTPQQSPDVWMSLALAAERTSRIGLGPGVLIPTLRHPMTNAAATVALEAMAPGRVAVSFGTGFTGRRAMGYGAIPWRFMVAYIEAFRGLVRGETIEWEGARMRMLHPDGSGAARPVDVPVLIGAIGPKGQEIARRLGDGLYVTTTTGSLEAGMFDWVAYLYWGTVLDDGEDPVTSERVRQAAGPGGALAYHASYELAGADAVAGLPGGAEWLASIRSTSESETPPGRPRRPLHRAERCRPRCLDGHEWLTAEEHDGHRLAPGRAPSNRRARRRRRDRSRLPAERPRHPPRARDHVRRLHGMRGGHR